MLNLAIECSGITGSVALYRDTVAIVERQLPDNVGSVQSLATTIDAILSLHSTRRADLVSVTCGPGSFTGLRAGLATAKMLAFAWKIPVIPVDTLAAIAHRVGSHYAGPLQSSQIVLPVLNAFRKQVFVSVWLLGDAGQSLTLLAPSQVVDAQRWQKEPLGALCMIQASCGTTLASTPIISGPGLRSYKPVSESQHTLALETLWDPQASDVALLGWKEYLAGKAVSAKELLPNYVRASAAEETARR